MCPFGESNLRYHLRFYVMHSPRGFHLAIKRVAICLELLESLPHIRMALFREAAARLPYGNQPILIVIKTENKRTKIFPASPRIGVAADDALLPLHHLHLEPFAAALLDVSAISQLGDNALELLLGCRLHQQIAFTDEVLGKTHNVVRDQHLAEQLFALFERNPQERITVEIQQI